MIDAVIIDMDGTYADVSGMRHYVMGEHKNFDMFHKAACLFAPINPSVAAYAHDAQALGIAVLVVTARKRMWGSYTKLWLDKHEAAYDRIYMRANDDQRKDYEVKRDILRRIRQQGYNVRLAVDDNPKVLKLWQEEGVETWRIPGWVEE